jgi:GMP synthase (glutamine-hydrolysing)
MQKILIIDFGSQYTQLIAKQIRFLHVYTEVIPYNKFNKLNKLNDNDTRQYDNIKGIILSGSPYSVINGNYPTIDFDFINNCNIPILGICYGSQLLAKMYGGEVIHKEHGEFGKHNINLITEQSHSLLFDIPEKMNVWMSHNDTIEVENKENSKIIILAKTNNDINAIFKIKDMNIYGIQFHPEVSHTENGNKFFYNFVKKCNITEDYTIKKFVINKINELKSELKNDVVIMAVSGGVDSTVAATLIHKAIGENLYCVFVDNGLLRKGEYHEVQKYLVHYGLNVVSLEESDRFYSSLRGLTDPEEKRKMIGGLFIKVFESYATSLKKSNITPIWLGQGTIYPDVIESVPGFGLIKSHHNVGGLPKEMNLKLIEPLRNLFKDEVRLVGKELEVPGNLIYRHPFPGPGLGIRILGEVTIERVKMLQEADNIFIQKLKQKNLYYKIWQAGVVLLPVKSVGVMGDVRTYQYTVALRAVDSENGMTAEPYDFTIKFIKEISTEIINKVKGINRVVYDISSKPPATIEWE